MSKGKPSPFCRDRIRAQDILYGSAVLGLIAIVWPVLIDAQSSLPPPSSMSTADIQNSEPITPLPLSISLDAKHIALGERLFNDPQLSGDNSRSCAHCHPLDKGAMDGRARALSNNNQTLRNTPTLFNVGFNFAFNWDGAISTLEDHSQKLLTNPAVMDAKWPDLLVKLRSDADYLALFASAFPDGVTQANVLTALATFERSLVTPNARFDRYLRGEQQALTEEELRGYQLFKSYGCVACHQGMNVGGNLFQKFGVFQDPNTLFYASGEEADIGRYRITSIDRDRGVFRVPSLRNVAVTAPYFHDGRARTLDVAVNTMGQVQLGRKLAPEEIQAIVSFLQTLTGEYRGTPLATLSSAVQ